MFTSPEPLYLRILWTLPHMGVMDGSLSVKPCSPPWRMGGEAANSKPLATTWSFWRPALIQEPLGVPQNYLTRTKDALITQEITRI